MLCTAEKNNKLPKATTDELILRKRGYFFQERLFNDIYRTPAKFPRGLK